MRVSDVMSRNVVTTRRWESLIEATSVTEIMSSPGSWAPCDVIVSFP